MLEFFSRNISGVISSAQDISLIRSVSQKLKIFCPVIRSGEDTFQQKPCNALAGVTIDNFFTPMVPCLRREVQDPKHIIPEDSMKCWVRGGLPSRQIVKNMEWIFLVLMKISNLVELVT